MGIQDDAFDVLAALEGRPEHAAFERIWIRFCDMERRDARMAAMLSTIQRGEEVMALVRSGEWVSRVFDGDKPAGPKGKRKGPAA